MIPPVVRRTLLTFAFLVAVAPRAVAQRGWADLGRRFDSFARAAGVIGGSAVLVRRGEIVARHHYGLADRDTKRKAGDRTIYHWASVTKTLTAIAVLQLRDRGLLSLDDRITRWVPELRDIHNPDAAADSITIAMLLSHSAGLQAPTWPWTEGESWEPFEPTAWSQLVAMMPYQRLLFHPGSRYSYSNPGFIYLARVIEKITGDPWAVYIQKNVWTPLGMDRSYVGATPYHLAADRSHGYRIEGDSITDIGADFDPGVTIPNSGWNAPVDDVARYLAFLSGYPPIPPPARATKACSAAARFRRCGDPGSRPARRFPSSLRWGWASSRWRTGAGGSWVTPAIRPGTAPTSTWIRLRPTASSWCSTAPTTAALVTARWPTSPARQSSSSALPKLAPLLLFLVPNLLSELEISLVPEAKWRLSGCLSSQ